jgi:hypothetical protein
MISLLTAFFLYYGDAHWVWWVLWVVCFIGSVLKTIRDES